MVKSFFLLSLIIVRFICSSLTTKNQGLTVGEMAEWLNALVLKTSIPARVSGVRIPLSPPVLLVLISNSAELFY